MSEEKDDKVVKSNEDTVASVGDGAIKINVDPTKVGEAVISLGKKAVEAVINKVKQKAEQRKAKNDETKTHL